MPLTFRGIPGHVFFRDGPYREVELTEDQCESLLDIWQAAEAVETFNELFDACRHAGFNPSTYGFKHLRLVSNNSPTDVVRNMLAASVEDLIAAQAMEQGL
jgi:hypothetical protein